MNFWSAQPIRHTSESGFQRSRTRIAALAASALIVAGVLTTLFPRIPPVDGTVSAPHGGALRGSPEGARSGDVLVHQQTLASVFLVRALEGLAAAAGASLLFLCGLAAARAALGEVAVVAGVVAAFEAGGYAPRSHAVGPCARARVWDEQFASGDVRARVPRPALLVQLSELLRPVSTATYALIVGESGTGKSTAVRAAVRALPLPKGVIYFSAPERVALFSDELANAVGFFVPFNPLASFFLAQAPRVRDAEPHTQWAALRTVLPLAAIAFRAAHGRPAVLIVDAADYVAKKDPTFFSDLQDFAKGCADSGSLRVIFVSSEGAALPIMRAASARSRMRMLEVPDIPDADAIEHLVCSGASRADAVVAVRDVAGGRFALLAQVAAAAEAGALAAFSDELGEATAATLVELDFPPTNAFFVALLQRGRIKRSEALVGLSPGELSALLARSILALHVDGAFTVHARHIEFWLRKAQSSGLQDVGAAL